MEPLLTFQQFERYKDQYGPELTIEDARALLQASYSGGQESYYAERAVKMGIEYRRKLQQPVAERRVTRSMTRGS